jgi:hypothetical protein
VILASWAFLNVTIRFVLSMSTMVAVRVTGFDSAADCCATSGAVVTASRKR